MKKSVKVSAVFLRLMLGWLFLYSGLTKVLDPAWSAATFLLLANLRAGQYLGFDQYLQKKFKNFWI